MGPPVCRFCVMTRPPYPVCVQVRGLWWLCVWLAGVLVARVLVVLSAAWSRCVMGWGLPGSAAEGALG